MSKEEILEEIEKNNYRLKELLLMIENASGKDKYENIARYKIEEARLQARNIILYRLLKNYDQKEKESLGYRVDLEWKKKELNELIEKYILSDTFKEYNELSYRIRLIIYFLIICDSSALYFIMTHLNMTKLNMYTYEISKDMGLNIKIDKICDIINTKIFPILLLVLGIHCGVNVYKEAKENRVFQKIKLYPNLDKLEFTDEERKKLEDKIIETINTISTIELNNIIENRNEDSIDIEEIVAEPSKSSLEYKMN